MKKKIYFITKIIALSLVFASCKKNVSSPFDNTNETGFSGVFDQFWNQMDVNYVYWNIDTTNWDNMYNQYKPIFAQLDINNPNDVKSSVEYFRQMTDGLIDSHYNITFLGNPITDSFVFPSLDRKRRNINFHNPYSYSSIDTVNYLDPGFISGTYINSDQQKIFAVSGTINNSILYFHCSQFNLLEAYQSVSPNGVKNVLQYFFNQLQQLPANIKGIIIDVRDNPGGSVTDLNFLVGSLVNQPFQFGYTHYKNGNGRLDYTPWVNANIMPQPNANAISLPIIALADNFSVSLAEATTMAIHTMPNGKFVGETTWGATGPIAENSLYDDGQFIVPGFLSVYTSSAEFKYIDGKMYEGKGFPPDVAVPFDINALNSGDDPILDKAMSLIQ